MLCYRFYITTYKYEWIQSKWGMRHSWLMYYLLWRMEIFSCFWLNWVCTLIMMHVLIVCILAIQVSHTVTQRHWHIWKGNERWPTPMLLTVFLRWFIIENLNQCHWESLNALLIQKPYRCIADIVFFKSACLC